jgi:hypothetical protein
VLPTPGAPPTPGSPTSPATLSQIPPNEAPATGTSKMTVMPLPANDGVTKNLREVTFPLYSAGGIPALEEVKQSPSLFNCPVPSILAAHAFTAVGRTRIQGMISTTTGPVLTDISALPAGELATPPAGDTIPSNRFFTVTLPNGTREVSDVFYTDDGDSVFFLIYLNDPSDGSLWGAVIEKALAIELGSYENFNDLTLTANDFWQRITGVQPAGFAITAATPLTDIINAAQQSVTRPTIAASRDEVPTGSIVTAFHGYAMIGVQGGRIHLYEPATPDKILLTPAEFRANFQAILHAPP